MNKYRNENLNRKKMNEGFRHFPGECKQGTKSYMRIFYQDVQKITDYWPSVKFWKDELSSYPCENESYQKGYRQNCGKKQLEWKIMKYIKENNMESPEKWELY